MMPPVSAIFMGSDVSVAPFRSEALARGARMLRTALGPAIGA